MDNTWFGGWGLPASLEFGGRAWAAYTDFRDILRIFGEMEDCGNSGEAAYLALALFYTDFTDMPPALYGEAWEAFCAFLRGGGAGAHGGDSGAGRYGGARLIDWRQDAALIAAEVNRVAGREVRAEAYVHWHTFLGWFRAIGEGPLATVVGIRMKRARGKKLSDWERDFLRDNRHLVELRRPADPAAEAEKARLLERLRQPPAKAGPSRPEGEKHET